VRASAGLGEGALSDIFVWFGRQTWPRLKCEELKVRLVGLQGKLVTSLLGLCVLSMDPLLLLNFAYLPKVGT
jgi:hypothetical protein